MDIQKKEGDKIGNDIKRKNGKDPVLTSKVVRHRVNEMVPNEGLSPI